MPKTEVVRTVEIDDAPVEVWAELGPFAAIDQWHPAVRSAVLETIDDVEHRRIVTLDGAEILERLVASDVGARTLKTSIVDGALPVTDHEAALTLEPLDGGARTRARWSARFETETPLAETLIGGFFETGLDALRRRCGP